jgi:aromatic ring-opening dioxygenase catalytic subunit (LigB family)
MGEFVSIMAMAHAPGVTGWIESCPVEDQQAIQAGYEELGRTMREARPDIIIGVGNDHLLNLPLKNPPNWRVDCSREWNGPAEFFKAWLKQPGYHVKGRTDISEVVAREVMAAGFKVDRGENLLFDDNWSVPLWYLGYDVPILPIHMNCINPPVPDPAECIRFGHELRRIVRDVLPPGLRVGLMGTGGLSHEPGGPRYFTMDSKFDRWFLALMEESDPDRVVREATIERMNDAGGGGTTELLAWMVAMAAAGGTPARTVFYVASQEMRCGIGGSVWTSFA